ncbi:MAG: 50S ribosomal protein L6 [Acidimicrobiales bacterium]|nr:MAG: 50S ribosomal protein L6 [Acidimicrobiales bacterium]
MSRVGNKPVQIPGGVEIRVEGRRVSVTGPKGTLQRELPGPVVVDVSEGVAQVRRTRDDREARALHGLSRALLANMVTGVSEGFRKELEIHGVGYRALQKGPSSIELQLGFSHPVVVDAPEGITFEVPSPTQVVVVGIDKERVGQVAADIRALRRGEPYKGKGIRYKGEQIRRKAGKAGISGG